MVPFLVLLKKNIYLCSMKITKKEQLFLDKLEKDGVVWNFDLIEFLTKDKKGYDKYFYYKTSYIAYDLIEKGLIKVNPENWASWIKT